VPDIRLVERVPPSFESMDDLLAMARRQLWVRPGSPKNARLKELVQDRAEERDGRFALEWVPTRIGIVTWAPPLHGQGEDRAGPVRQASWLGASGAALRLTPRCGSKATRRTRARVALASGVDPPRP